MTKFLTFDEIVADVLRQLDDGSICTLRNMPRDSMVVFHHGQGRYIRNEYKLWNPDNPLTKQWHKDRENDGKVGINASGVDCHPQHPDAVSTEVLFAVWDKVNEFWEETKKEIAE